MVVIAAIMLSLTLLTGSIDRMTTQRFPGGAVTEVDGGFVVKSPEAGERRFAAADGYSFRSTDDAVVVRGKERVNKFFNPDNLVLVATQASFIAIMAVGMTGIIIMGGIDLSVGSIYALAAVCGAMVLESYIGTMNAPLSGGQPSMFLAILITVGVCGVVGAMCGFVNGAATVGLKVHPFIITLGGMAVYRGIAFVSTDGQTIGPFPESFTASFGKLPIFGATAVPMLLMATVAIVGAVVLVRTVFGRQTFAIGGNEIAARYAGVPVGRVKIWLFTLCGLLAGLSAALYLGYFGAGGSDAGKGYELNVIAAAVVGGASLSGGRGSAVGAVLGALVIQLIDNSILMLGVDQNYKEIVIGLAIVIAVVVDQTKQRLGSKR